MSKSNAPVKAILLLLCASYVAFLTVTFIDLLLVKHKLAQSSFVFGPNDLAQRPEQISFLEKIGATVRIQTQDNKSASCTGEIGSYKGSDRVAAKVIDLSDHMKAAKGGAVSIAGLLVTAICLSRLPKRLLRLVATCSPTLAAAMLLPLVGSCNNCFMTDTASHQFVAASVILIPFALGGALAKTRTSSSAVFASYVCLGILLVQVLLEGFDPRLCTFCITLGVCIQSVLAWLLRGLEVGDTSPIQLGWQIYLVCAFASVSLLSLLGLLKLKAPDGIDANNFLNTNISRWNDANLRGLLLVSLPGCDACKKAKLDLLNAKVSFTEVTLCGSVRQKGCFEATNKVVAPLILLIDKEGMIVNQQNGWFASDNEVASFISKVMPNNTRG